MATSTWSGTYFRSLQSPTAAQAFDGFRSQRVDLDSEEVKTARRSRDYLQTQIEVVAANDPSFPPLVGGHKPFGSFARSTKVRPLDDIDMLTLMNGHGTRQVQDYYGAYTYRVEITDNQAPLAPFADQNGNVSSTPILNRFRDGLKNVPNYQKAAIKRNGVAVVLDLKSYDWVFDIVPTIPIGDWNGNTTHYLIPNGSGKWMRTDPRKDQNLISRANQAQNGNMIPLIRLIKYWNQYSRAAPRLMSYYLETMLITGMQYHYPPFFTSCRKHVPDVFRSLSQQVVGSCPDPKGLGPNLDEGLTWNTRQSVRDATVQRAQYSQYALDEENRGNHDQAIYWWGRVFTNFTS